MGTTNYINTFIQVADDCPVAAAEVPPRRRTPSVAALQYELIIERPYELTSDDLLFEVHVKRMGVAGVDRRAAREGFFARPQACLRSSPLCRRYGWGIHHAADSTIALVPLGSDEYRRLARDPGLKQLKGMRSHRS